MRETKSLKCVECDKSILTTEHADTKKCQRNSEQQDARNLLSHLCLCRALQHDEEDRHTDDWTALRHRQTDIQTGVDNTGNSTNAKLVILAQILMFINCTSLVLIYRMHLC